MLQPTNMQKKKLGHTDIEIAPWMFGGNVFGWTVDEPASHHLLDAFVQAGFNAIDTADVYSRWAPGNKGGESETIIGRWLKQKGTRHQVVIATKVGSDMGQGKSLKKDYILKAAEDSLRRLQTDYIDLYQTHYDDESTPVEETLEAYARLVQQGKVRAIGASNMSPQRLQQSLQWSQANHLPSYQTLQPLYNLYSREEFEKELEPICQQYGLSVINYYALASGFLTGKYRSEADLHKSKRGSGIKKYLNDRGRRILQALDTVAAQYGANPAQVSIAWLLTRPTVTAPIASVTHIEQMQDIIKGVQLQLDATAVSLLNQASEWRASYDD